MWDSSSFCRTFTPEFMVELLGASTLISGLILAFEWWSFHKYGRSFIPEQHELVVTAAQTVAPLMAGYQLFRCHNVN